MSFAPKLGKSGEAIKTNWALSVFHRQAEGGTRQSVFSSNN